MGKPFALVGLGSGSNGCALVSPIHSPCLLERRGVEIDWRVCERVDELSPSLGPV